MHGERATGTSRPGGPGGSVARAAPAPAPRPSGRLDLHRAVESEGEPVCGWCLRPWPCGSPDAVDDTLEETGT